MRWVERVRVWAHACGREADRGVEGALLLVLSSSASNARDRRTRVDVKRLKRVVVALLLKS